MWPGIFDLLEDSLSRGSSVDFSKLRSILISMVSHGRKLLIDESGERTRGKGAGWRTHYSTSVQ